MRLDIEFLNVRFPLYYLFMSPSLTRSSNQTIAQTPPPRVSDPDMHHGTCVTCMPGLLISGFLESWRGKRSQHSRCMRNPQFFVSIKRPVSCRQCDFNKSNSTSTRHLRFSECLSGSERDPDTSINKVNSWQFTSIHDTTAREQGLWILYGAFRKGSR